MKPWEYDSTAFERERDGADAMERLEATIAETLQSLRDMNTALVAFDASFRKALDLIARSEAAA